MNIFGTRMDTDFTMRRKLPNEPGKKSVRSVRSVWENKINHPCGRNNYPWESRVSEVIEDGTDLASGEELTVAVVACGVQLLQERLVAVDPTHQVVGGDARVAVGKVEHGKLLFAVTSYFHT